jgi:hypothetical protein
MDFDPTEAVELLVSSAPARSQQTFPYERQIRLCQFQTWIYFPEEPLDMVRMAGSLAAVKYLNIRERELLPTSSERAASTTELQRFLRDPIYKKLFDETFADYGTWTDFVLMLEERFDFERELSERIERAETVCKMIDYRFRYLDHGGTDRHQANISHSEFFRWKSGPDLSWKKIRERWSRNRRNAVFLYVSEGLGLRLSPSFEGVGFFASDISKDAESRNHICRFFGTCAYISEILRGEEGGVDDVGIPTTVKRVRPQTDPLSESERQKMESYTKAERDRMRRS